MGLASNHRTPRLIVIVDSEPFASIQAECSFVLIVYISIPNVLYQEPQQSHR